MKLGCHCVLYGAQVAENTDDVLDKLTLAGAKGCEIGERFFHIDQADRLKAKLKEHHMELAGMHCNGLKLIDLIHNPEAAETAILNVAKVLTDMENRNIIVTGGLSDMESLKSSYLKDGASEPELHNPAAVKKAAENLEKITQKTKDLYGAQVNYHNHSWEFADNGLIFFTLADHCPSVHFALDTGWAAVSGFDPIEIMKKYPGRFHYIHLRDFKKTENSGDLLFQQVHAGFAPLGSGDMNYPHLMSFLSDILGEQDWAIVEYELGNFDHLSYLKAINYLGGILDTLDYQKGGDKSWKK